MDFWKPREAHMQSSLCHGERTHDRVPRKKPQWEAHTHKKRVMDPCVSLRVVLGHLSGFIVNLTALTVIYRDHTSGCIWGNVLREGKLRRGRPSLSVGSSIL